MDNNINEFQNIPVTVFFAVSIIIIFSLYLTSAIKSIPCGKDVLSSFYSQFVHIEPTHLAVNLFALYSLSRVEKKIGAVKFLSLLVFLLVFNTLAEVTLHKIVPNLPCSIGFSGVLFGIMTWEITTTKQIDLYLLASIAGMVITPTIKNPKASLSGHAIGAVSGIIGGVIWKKLAPEIGLNNT